MTSGVVVGIVAVVIGGFAFWQRERISQWNRAWNKRMGKPGEFASTIGTPKAYGVGALLMVLGGLTTVLYSLVTGTAPTTTNETVALWTIVFSGVLLVILIITALLLYRRYKNKNPS